MLTRATFPHPNPAIGDKTLSHLVISLRGEESSKQENRSHLSVIPVVDVSGSMGAERKLPLVTSALGWLGEHLGENDQLALVAFDSAVHFKLNLIQADTTGITQFATALRSLRPGSATALYDGLAKGIETANKTPASNLTRVIVLTDGQANAGPTDLDSLATLLAQRKSHVSVSFLGVGTDCDHNLLGDLADLGGGSYGFIENAADAPSALGNEIGGLLDAEAHNLTVSVELNSSYCSFAAQTPLGLPAEFDGKTMTLQVAQVLRGVTKNIIIPVTLFTKNKNHARAVTCATVQIKGRTGDEEFTVELRPKVKFSAQAGKVDAALLEKVELAQIAEAIRQAKSFAVRGDFQGAQAVFGQYHMQSAAALSLQESLVSNYQDQHAYTAGSSLLSSAKAATTGTLSNSSASFTNLAYSTIGSLYSDGQRRMAAGANRNSNTAVEADEEEEQQ